LTKINNFIQPNPNTKPQNPTAERGQPNQQTPSPNTEPGTMLCLAATRLKVWENMWVSWYNFLVPRIVGFPVTGLFPQASWKTNSWIWGNGCMLP